MRNLILAGAAALSFAAIPAIAQTTMSMTTEQQTMYDGWTAENRAMYDAWPATYRTYYWTLSPAQQTGWWALNDDQRTRVYAMTPEQRTAAWASITAQMAGSTMPTTTSSSMSSDASASANMSSDTSTSTMSSGNMQFVRREMTQPVAASADTAALASGDLPVCKANQQDGCINSWEKNKTGTRPLNYWPGKPASEIPGKKPQG